jgi:hypothetical protein
MKFQSLEQRMAQTYLDTFPVFVPSDGGPGIEEQRAFYQLIRSVYQLALNEPELLTASFHEDDAYPNRFNKSSYKKPDLRRYMQAFTKAVDDMISLMYQMGIEKNAVKPSKRQQDILERLGINGTDALPPAWIWMSTREGAGLLSFSKCLFKNDYPYPSEVYARLLGDEKAFHRLEDWMLGRGYIRYCCLDGQLSMDYANPAWDLSPPLGGNLNKIRHTGIAVRYDGMIQEPPCLGLCIPHGMKKYLEAFESMDTGLKSFVVAHTKKCDACGYCTQTDKTGTRPRACIPVKHNAEITCLCPIFPGYSFCWTSLTEARVDNIIAMLSFMDGLICKYGIGL